MGFPYDYMSIMQYENTAFTTNGLNTIETTNPAGVRLINAGFKSAISDIDAQEIRKLYGCVNY